MLVTETVPSIVPPATEEASLTRIVKSAPASIEKSVIMTKSVASESSVDVTRMLIGRPASGAPVEDSRTPRTTVCDWPTPRTTDV